LCGINGSDHDPRMSRKTSGESPWGAAVGWVTCARSAARSPTVCTMGGAAPAAHIICHRRVFAFISPGRSRRPHGRRRVGPARTLNRKYGRRHLLKTRPGDRTRRSGPPPGGHGMEGLPPSWSLHRVMASLWSSRVQVPPPRVLHGSEPWALAERRCGPHGRAPPGRPEPQLEPPGGWGRHCGAPALPLNS
jgi:hypothetical protein